MAQPSIYSFSVVHTASVEFQDKTPYACAIIEDEDGRHSCILEGYEAGRELAVGMPVQPAGVDEAGKKRYRL